MGVSVGIPGCHGRDAVDPGGGTVREEWRGYAVDMPHAFRRLLAVASSTLILMTVVAVAPVAACDQGCTPGYWKNHTDAWVTYSPGETLTEAGFVFPLQLSSFGSEPLIVALQGGGGPGLDGAARILLRAGVAALLNSVAFPYPHYVSTSVVLSDMNTVLASLDRQTMLDEAAEYDGYNSVGCPY